MQPSNKKNAVLPFTFTVYRGRGALVVHQYSSALFHCQSNKLLFSKDDPWSYHGKWLSAYKDKRAFHGEDESPLMDYYAPLRVRSGKPVQTDMLDSMCIFLEVSPATSDFCSFEHDKASGYTTLVLDEGKLDAIIPEGLYKAACKIQSTRDFWKTDNAAGAWITNHSAAEVVTISVTLKEYTGPLFPPRQQATKRQVRSSADALPHTLQYYIDDFKRTFNIT